MPDPTDTSPSPGGFRALTALLGFGLLALVVCFKPPAWYAYLNWNPAIPGAATTALFGIGILVPLMTVVMVSLMLFKTRELVLAPLLLASIFFASKGLDVARHVGYTTGVAKVECWTPGTRECLIGKFERIEMLKDPVTLTDKEQAVFTAFKHTRAKFEATKPGMGKAFETWAHAYRAALDEVFEGYPRAWGQP